MCHLLLRAYPSLPSCKFYSNLDHLCSHLAEKNANLWNDHCIDSQIYPLKMACFPGCSVLWSSHPQYKEAVSWYPILGPKKLQDHRLQNEKKTWNITPKKHHPNPLPKKKLCCFFQAFQDLKIFGKDSISNRKNTKTSLVVAFMKGKTHCCLVSKAPGSLRGSQWICQPWTVFFW